MGLTPRAIARKLYSSYARIVPFSKDKKQRPLPLVCKTSKHLRFSSSTLISEQFSKLTPAITVLSAA